jgi:hypothetical protein
MRVAAPGRYSGTLGRLQTDSPLGVRSERYPSDG